MLTEEKETQGQLRKIAQFVLITLGLMLILVRIILMGMPNEFSLLKFSVLISGLLLIVLGGGISLFSYVRNSQD